MGSQKLVESVARSCNVQTDVELCSLKVGKQCAVCMFWKATEGAVTLAPRPAQRRK